jgi:hypothetical protein
MGVKDELTPSHSILLTIIRAESRTIHGGNEADNRGFHACSTNLRAEHPHENRPSAEPHSPNAGSLAL